MEWGNNTENGIMKTQGISKVSPAFYDPPQRKTSAEIINEARLAIRESQMIDQNYVPPSIKPLQTQRPYTPRDKERLLFGNKIKSNRPPSSFSLRYLQNETDLPTTPPDNDNLLSANLITSRTLLSPPKGRPQRSSSISEINDKIFNIAVKDSLHKVKLPSLDNNRPLQKRKVFKNTSLDNLPEENEHRPLRKAEGRNAFSSPQERTDFQDSRPRRAPNLSKCLLLGPQNFFDNKQIVENSQTLFLGAGFFPNAAETAKKKSNSAPKIRSFEDVLSELKSKNDDEKIAKLLNELYERVENEAGKIGADSKIKILKCLYEFVESRNEKILICVAKIILSMKVTGNNLSGVCKLIFKVAKNDKNDHLFFQKNLLELFLDALGRSSPLDDAEACVYGYGAVKFLTMNQKLLDKISGLGILQLMVLHMKIVNTAHRNTKMSSNVRKPLTFAITAECKTSKARVAKMILPHGPVDTPVFMPVGTQGTLKGMLPEQLNDMGLQIMLANTYHLGAKPGAEVLKKAGGLHKFMNWQGNLLTDSGGFQMVSLLKLAEIGEDGVKFRSLNSQKDEITLTPEHSVEIQNAIGADIVMQLDDVVKTTSKDKERVEESVHRTTRWLDRCIKAHANPDTQNIFPIVQGTLHEDLRKISIDELTKRDTNGFAIGGLSGGESKEDFWKIVHLCTNYLPKDKPRYLMGVGFATDLVVCSALGVDMFDCVFPTRTAKMEKIVTPDQTDHALYQLTGALRNLVSEDRNYDVFIESGTVPQLCRTLETFRSDSDVIANVSRTLSIISTNERCCDSIVEYKNVYRVFVDSFRKYPGNEEIIVRLTYTLGNIVSKIDNSRVQFFHEENSVESLVDLWRIYLERTLKNCCLKLDSNVEVQSNSEDVMIKIIRVIANMVINPDIGKRMNEKYGDELIEEILKVLISNPFKKNEDLVLSILTTLNNLSYYCTSESETDVFHVKQVDIVEATTEYAKSNNKECVTETMRILGNLSRSKITRNFIAESDVFEILVDLLDRGEQTLLKTTVGVFVNLMSDDRSRVLFKNNGGVCKLVKMLSEECDHDWSLANLVCQVLWNYCIDTNDLHDLFSDTEIHKLLVVLADYLDEEKLFGIEDHMEDMEVYVTQEYLVWEEFANVATNLLEKIEYYLDTFDQLNAEDKSQETENKKTKDSSTNITFSTW